MIKALALVSHMRLVCRKPDIGFTTKCEVQGTMSPKECV
jgi:hypothetical protein